MKEYFFIFSDNCEMDVTKVQMLFYFLVFKFSAYLNLNLKKKFFFGISNIFSFYAYFFSLKWPFFLLYVWEKCIGNIFHCNQYFNILHTPMVPDINRYVKRNINPLLSNLSRNFV